MKKLFILTLIFIKVNLFAQVNYIGFIDKYPIELFAEITSGNDTNAVYVYSNIDEPINLTGNFENGTVTFFEKDKKGKKTASMIFANYNPDNNKINGIWTDLKTKKELKITLTKKAENPEGIIQTTSINDKYFRVVTDYQSTNEIRIYQKKTDKLLQNFAVECRFSGANSIEVDDFNFDELPDFSIFETSYAGPNTSSLYFLYNPKTKKYFDSGFTGVSLEFDSKTKRITETNSCCAGSSVVISEYKLVKNKMILTKEKCLKWSEEKQELIERKAVNCR